MGFKKINLDSIKKLDYIGESNNNLKILSGISSNISQIDNLVDNKIMKKSIPLLNNEVNIDLSKHKILCVLEKFEEFLFENIDTVEEQSKNRKLQYQYQDKVLIINQGAKSKIWNVAFTLRRNNKNIKLFIDQLNPEGTWHWSSDLEKVSVEEINKTDFDIVLPLSISEQIKLENQDLLQNNILLLPTGKQNVLNYKITLKSNVPKNIFQIKLAKSLPSNTQEIIDLSYNNGSVQINNLKSLTWNIQNLSPDEVAVLDFKLKLMEFSLENPQEETYTRDLVDALQNTGRIRVQYSYTYEDLNFNLIDFKANTKFANYNSISKIPQRDSWNYSTKLINQSEFELELIKGEIKYLDNDNKLQTIALNRIETIPPLSKMELLNFNFKAKHKPELKVHLDINVKNKVASIRTGIIDIKGKPIKYSNVVIEKELSQYSFIAFRKIKDLGSRLTLINHGNLEFNALIILERIPEGMIIPQKDKDFQLTFDNISTDWETLNKLLIEEKELLPLSIKDIKPLFNLDLNKDSFDLNYIFENINSLIAANEISKILENNKILLKRYVFKSINKLENLLVWIIVNTTDIKRLLKKHIKNQAINVIRDPHSADGFDNAENIDNIDNIDNIETNHNNLVELYYFLNSDGLEPNKEYSFPYKILYFNQNLKPNNLIFKSDLNNTPKIDVRFIDEKITIGKIIDNIKSSQYYIRLLLHNYSDNAVHNLLINEIIPANSIVSNSKYHYKVIHDKAKDLDILKWYIDKIHPHQELEIRYLLDINESKSNLTNLNDLEFWIEYNNAI
ncbi:MAG: hypothetical protein ACTSU2_12270 [Promethearchaeota archaeon]